MNTLSKKFAGLAFAAWIALPAGVPPVLAQTAPAGQPATAERDVLFIRQVGPPVPPPEGASGVYWFGGGEAGVPAIGPAGPLGPPAEPHMGPMISFVSAVGGFGGGTVTGAPYSAEAVTVIEQRLADGNRISRRTTATIYRDSEGRTRRDQTLGAIGPWVVGGDLPQISSIYDPVAGARYTLNHARQTAHKLPALPTPPGASGLGAEIRRRVHTEVASGLAHAAGAAALVAGTEPTEAGEHIQPFEIPLPPPHDVGFRAGIVAPASSADQRSESLGKQLIEGVEAEGTRSISTIPAGAIGNDFAIEIVSERWYSPALQAVVLSLHKDPRMGETTYRLSNIQRTEPARSLFEIPAGYTVLEPGIQAFPPPGLSAPPAP